MILAEIIDWSVALLPVLIMLGGFIWLDMFKLMTFWETVGLLLLGALAAAVAYPISGRMIDTLPIGFSTYSRFVAPWIEEALKGAVIVGLFAFNRIGFKLDAVISGFAVGAGFSVVENMIYLWRFPELTANLWMVRGLGTAVMHGSVLAVLAATAHEFAERRLRGPAADHRLNPLWFVPGFVAAALLHTLFNQFPERPFAAMLGTLLIAPLALMMVLHWGAKEARAWLAADREAHRAQLETLKAGRLPDDDSGLRIAALAVKVGPLRGELVREYYQLYTELLLCAEDALLSQAGTDERLEFDAEAGFERLEQLERELGFGIHATLKALLPFSRNDHWEITELHERLRPGR